MQLLARSSDRFRCKRSRYDHGIGLTVAGGLAAIWYLVSPPPLVDANGSPGTLVDADRPTAEWQRMQSFATAGECRTHLKDWQIEAHGEVEHASKPVPARLLLELNRREASRCVSEPPKPH